MRRAKPVKLTSSAEETFLCDLSAASEIRLSTEAGVSSLIFYDTNPLRRALRNAGVVLSIFIHSNRKGAVRFD